MLEIRKKETQMGSKKKQKDVGVFQMMKYISGVPTNWFDKENDLKKLQERMEMIISNLSKHLIACETDDLERIIRSLSKRHWFLHGDKYYEYNGGDLDTIRKYLAFTERVCRNCSHAKFRVKSSTIKYFCGLTTDRYYMDNESFISQYVQEAYEKSNCEEFESEKFASLKSVRDLIISVLQVAITDEVEMRITGKGSEKEESSMTKHYSHISVYEEIRDGKIKTTKKIFRGLGEDFAPYADYLTDEELIKSFDYFNILFGRDDDNGTEIEIMLGYIEDIASEFPIKTLRILEESDALVPKREWYVSHM